MKASMEESLKNQIYGSKLFAQRVAPCIRRKPMFYSCQQRGISFWSWTRSMVASNLGVQFHIVAPRKNVVFVL